MQSRKIRLRGAERRYLREMRRKGRHSTRVLLRVQILLLAHKDWSTRKIEEATGASAATIKRTKRWYQEDGLNAAIFDAPRPGRPKKVDKKALATIIATACSEAPEGHSRWTYELIAQHAPLEEPLSAETIRLVMKADGIKPWREKNVVHANDHSRVSGENVQDSRTL